MKLEKELGFAGVGGWVGGWVGGKEASVLFNGRRELTPCCAGKVGGWVGGWVYLGSL